jgi:hypothetical protein
MSDPRPPLRATYGHWLRVRDRVRALEASLAAAEHRLQRDARQTDDPDMAILAAQLAAERQAVRAVATELDAHIATVKGECDAIESTHVEAVVAAARTKTCGPGETLTTTGELATAPVDESERR